MKTFILLISIFFTSSVYTVDGHRLKTINYSYGTSATIEKTRFAYDSDGNVIRVTFFSGNGSIDRIHYYFYENGCVNKILEFKNGKILSKSLLRKDTGCRTLVHDEYDPTGKLIKRRENLYDEQGHLRGFNFLNGKTEIVGTGRIVYAGDRMTQAIFEEPTGTQEMLYVYDDKKRLKSIRHIIVEKNGPSYENRMTFEFDIGPVTEESSRYLFE